VVVVATVTITTTSVEPAARYVHSASPLAIVDRSLMGPGPDGSIGGVYLRSHQILRVVVVLRCILVAVGDVYRTRTGRGYPWRRCDRLAPCCLEFGGRVSGYVKAVTANEHVQGRRSGAAGEQVSVLLIADPGEPAAIAEYIAEYLPERLRGSDRLARRWTTCVRRKPYLPDEQADFADVIDTVDPSSEEEDVVVYLTDLPRREDTLPVVADVSDDHKFALISVAGVGGVHVERRVRTVTELAIARVLGEPVLGPGAARRFPSAQTEDGVRYFAPSGLRRLRLLSGMVRANRPWRLVTGLSKVLVGAFATGAIALATNTIWLFADTMGPWRMGAATVLSIAAMILWLILEHELWERPESPTERDRSVLYNTATVVTLVIGVVVLYVALFGLLLFTASLTLPPELLSRVLGHGVNLADYLTLAWLLASIATIGGALGSGLEDDAAVKEAAYGVRQRQRIEETRQSSNEAR
jgi:hypothetical protein